MSTPVRADEPVQVRATATPLLAVIICQRPARNPAGRDTDGWPHRQDRHVGDVQGVLVQAAHALNAVGGDPLLVTAAISIARDRVGREQPGS
ncbi:MAG: hypothetical protein KIT69_00460 [Propionibacteriaceae bacterium]|nr:hypothetical protein [Propionibacteriaceae bacterium]